jgi:hypothetical protein
MGKIQLVDRGPIRGPSPIEMTDFESSFEAPSYKGPRGRSCRIMSVLGVKESEHSVDSLIPVSEYVDRTNIESKALFLIAHRGEVLDTYKTPETYYNDARTLLFEALTASGHLSRVEISGALDEIHRTMLSVLLNAYSDDLPKHELQRRFQEICEELTVQEIELKIAAGEISPDTSVTTISDIIPLGFMSSDDMTKIGYRVKNEKGMVRDHSLQCHGSGRFTRVAEQVSRSNSNCTRSRRSLSTRGLINSVVDPNVSDDLVVLGSQVLNRMRGGVIDVMEYLDTDQSQECGVTIRYGEEAHAEQPDYNDLRVESVRRETAAECYIQGLADFTEQLDQKLKSGDITQEQYDDYLGARILETLRSICVVDPSYAVDCFGQNAKAGFDKASNLAAAGDYGGAARIIENNRSREETVTYCGASITEDEAKAKGINFENLKSLTKKGVEAYKTKTGRCRVEECPTSPDKTEVGPCSVCTGSCQKLYDKGWKYNKIVKFYRSLKRVKGKLQNKVSSTKKSVSGWFFGIDNKE